MVDLPAPSGQRKQLRRRGFRTKKAADDALLQVLRQTDRYHVGDRDRILEAFSEEWIPTLDLRPRTIAEHQTYLEKHIIPNLGGYRLADLTTPMIERFYRDLGKSPWVVRRVHSTLRRMLADAVRWGDITANPAALARPPSIPKRKHRTATTRALLDALSALGDDRWYAMWRLAIITGMRRSELAGLRWTDIGDGLVHVKRSKTDAGVRTLPLDPQTEEALAQWRGLAMREVARWPGRSWDDDGYVWVWEDGKQIRPEYITARWRKLRDRIGLPGVRFHDLRHGWASSALAEGVDAKIVQAMLGHSTVAVTLDVYSHVSDSMMRDALDQVLRSGENQWATR